MNTTDLKQTLVARACSYELAQAIADEIERLRATVARQRAWIDGVMAQEPKFYWNERDDTFAYADDAGIMALCTPLFTRPAPFEDK